MKTHSTALPAPCSLSNKFCQFCPTSAPHQALKEKGPGLTQVIPSMKAPVQVKWLCHKFVPVPSLISSSSTKMLALEVILLTHSSFSHPESLGINKREEQIAL